MSFSIKIPHAPRYFLYSIWLILSFTGLYFAYFQDWQMQDPSDFTVNVLKAHGIAAAIFLLILGALLAVHIQLAFKVKRNLITGISMLSLMILLALTGTALYYSPEEWHENVKWGHIIIGLVSICWLPIHILTGIYQRKSKT